MAGKTTRVRVNRELAEEAMRALGVRSRSEAARVAVDLILKREQPGDLAHRVPARLIDQQAKPKK